MLDDKEESIDDILNLNTGGFSFEEELALNDTSEDEEEPLPSGHLIDEEPEEQRIADIEISKEADVSGSDDNDSRAEEAPPDEHMAYGAVETGEEKDKAIIDVKESFYEPAQTKSGRKTFRMSPLLRMFVPIAAVLVVLAVFLASGSDFAKNYKENLKRNISVIAHNAGLDNLFEHSVSEKKQTVQNKEENQEQPEKVTEYKPPKYKTKVKSSVAIPFEAASESGGFAKYKRGAVCAGINFLCYFHTDGKEQWRVNTAIKNPILKSEGAYIALAERNGKRLCLYNGRHLLYDVETDENILSMEMNKDGDVVIVKEKSSYKGAVAVYNKMGENIFTWSSGKDIISSADISAGTRRVAAALVNTDDEVYTTISLFDVTKADSYAKLICENTMIFDIRYSGNILSAFGDNSMIGLDTSGGLVYDKRFDNVGLAHSAVDLNGNKIMAFEYENTPVMNIYNNSGIIEYTITAKSMPGCIDMSSYNILYTDSRDIILGKPNSRRPYKYTAAMDIKDIVLIDFSSFLIVYSNSIEIVRM